MHHAHIDKFAYQDSPVHRLDARAKFFVTIAFTVVILLLPKTSISLLACYAIGPFAVLTIGRVPLKFAIRQVILVSPFILVLAITFPFYLHEPTDIAFGPFTGKISLGWIRCFNVIGKFIVTMLALIAMVSTTRFGDLLAAMQKMHVPQLLTIQLGFLYRYIFVLIDRAGQILRARAGRKLRNLGFKTEIKTASAMLGSLFVRSIDTAEQIDIAMQSRGFDGHWRCVSRLKFHKADFLFMLISAAFLLLLYFYIGRIL